MHCLSLQKYENWLPPSSIHLLMVQFQYACIMVSELLIIILWKTTLSTRTQCLYPVPFAFSVTVFTQFQIYFGQHLFLLPPSVRLFHFLKKYLHSLSQTLLPPGNLISLKLFLFNLHTLSFTFCVVKFN